MSIWSSRANSTEDAGAGGDSVGQAQVLLAPDADVIRLEAGLGQLLHGGLLDAGEILLARLDDRLGIQQGLIELVGIVPEALAQLRLRAQYLQCHAR